MAELTNAFARVRPWVFTADGHCLVHALTLVLFLSHYGIYAEWVLGVRTRPWGAHSWVQVGSAILDSTPEKVWDFEPILAI
jgi:hypothetical protein